MTQTHRDVGIHSMVIHNHIKQTTFPLCEHTSAGALIDSLISGACVLWLNRSCILHVQPQLSVRGCGRVSSEAYIPNIKSQTCTCIYSIRYEYTRADGMFESSPELDSMEKKTGLNVANVGRPPSASRDELAVRCIATNGFTLMLRSLIGCKKCTNSQGRRRRRTQLAACSDSAF